MADTVIEIAAACRRGTAGRKLVVFFYGYLFEFAPLHNGAPYAGHYALSSVLASPDIDVLCSPISYFDRQWQGTGASMTTAESVMMHGKLWLNEDDTRTYLAHTKQYGGVTRLRNLVDGSAGKGLVRRRSHLGRASPFGIARCGNAATQ